MRLLFRGRGSANDGRGGVPFPDALRFVRVYGEMRVGERVRVFDGVAGLKMRRRGFVVWVQWGVL